MPFLPEVGVACCMVYLSREYCYLRTYVHVGDAFSLCFLQFNSIQFLYFHDMTQINTSSSLDREEHEVVKEGHEKDQAKTRGERLPNT